MRDGEGRVAAVVAALPSCGPQNVFAALLDYFVQLEESLISADLRRTLLAATSASQMREALEAYPKKEAKDLMSYLFHFVGKCLLPALAKSDFDEPGKVLAAVLCTAIFWDPKDMRRIMLDARRCFSATIIMVNEFEVVFPRVSVAPVVQFDDSLREMELRKREAKLQYEAGERERARIQEEKERLERVAQQKTSVSAAEDKRRKEELQEMVAAQRREFEEKQLEAKKEEEKNLNAFEKLQRQQQELKARNEKKLQKLKEETKKSGLGQSNSEASLDSFLSSLNAPKTGSSDSLADRVRGGAKARVASMQSLTTNRSSSSSAMGTRPSPPSLRPSSLVATEPTATDDSGLKEVPMIKIPVLSLTKEQQRMIIVVPSLSFQQK